MLNFIYKIKKIIYTQMIRLFVNPVMLYYIYVGVLVTISLIINFWPTDSLSTAANTIPVTPVDLNFTVKEGTSPVLFEMYKARIMGTKIEDREPFNHIPLNEPDAVKERIATEKRQGTIVIVGAIGIIVFIQILKSIHNTYISL